MMVTDAPLRRLEELVAALVDDRTCADRNSMWRQGCAECERIQPAMEKRVAARRWFTRQENSVALARLVLQVVKALEGVRCQCPPSTLCQRHQEGRITQALGAAYTFGKECGGSSR